MSQRAKRCDRENEYFLIDEARESFTNENGLNAGLHEGGELHRNKEELEEEVNEEEVHSLAHMRIGVSYKVDEEFSYHDTNRD